MKDEKILRFRNDPPKPKTPRLSESDKGGLIVAGILFLLIWSIPTLFVGIGQAEVKHSYYSKKVPNCGFHKNYIHA